MLRLDVDWADLELALRDAATDSYLDKESGAVVSVVVGFDDERDLRDKLARFPDRFLRLPPLEAAFTRDALRAFAERVDDKGLRKKLQQATEGKGGVATGIALLKADARLWAAFARFEQGELWERLQQFLKQSGVAPASPPPAVELLEGVLS
jgi:hypothetical protein